MNFVLLKLIICYGEQKSYKIIMAIVIPIFLKKTNKNSTLHLSKPPQIPHINLHKSLIDLQSTSQILQTQANDHDQIDHFHALLKQEMNCDTWRDPNNVDVLCMIART
jgi:hypothetical protein